MKKPVTNIPASILARLRKQTDEMSGPFAEVLQYYAMERFLYRLSKTRYADKFILKGRLLFCVWNIAQRRPTRDIDFRGYVAGDSETLSKIIHEVIAISAPEDGFVFNSKSISVEETQLDADYQGIRVKLTSGLARTKIPIQIDIGFSDELTSKGESIEYPTILPDLKTVHLKGYPRETVVAEKFHAMVRHGDLNSRMKDYYDLLLLAEIFEFKGASLQKAIETIFKKRDTELPIERPASLTVEFARVSQTRWGNFLRNMYMGNEEVLDLQTVIERIWKFLKHPLQSSINKTRSTRNWLPRKGWK